VGHAQKTPSKTTKDYASRAWEKPKRTWTGGKHAGLNMAPTCCLVVPWMRVAEEKSALLPLPIEPFRYYQYASAACIWTAASRSKLPSTALRQAGSGTRSKCSGIVYSFVYSTPRPVSCCASTFASNGSGIASKTKIVRSGRPAHSSAAVAHRPSWVFHRRALRGDPSSARRSRRSPHPGRPFLG
jgi:hypothetical protein